MSAFPALLTIVTPSPASSMQSGLKRQAYTTRAAAGVVALVCF
jgi:hypothetical protein